MRTSMKMSMTMDEHEDENGYEDENEHEDEHDHEDDDNDDDDGGLGVWYIQSYLHQ